MSPPWTAGVETEQAASVRAGIHRSSSKIDKANKTAPRRGSGSDLLLHERVYNCLRWLILTHSVPRGSRLPGSRTLALQMAVSRNTVLNALDRLVADDWVEARRGSGVYVTYAGPRLSKPSGTLNTSSDRPPFSLWARALDLFPKQLWNKLQSRRWRHLDSADLVTGDPFGWLPLREAIAAHVAIMRNVECSPENIVITNGGPAAIDLAVRALNLSGSEAWIEDPGYDGFRESLGYSAVRAVPVPVDDAGLDVLRGIAIAPEARLAVVTPACQFPTCAVMTQERRALLLEWAAAHNAWIIDNDYDWPSTDWRKGPKPLAATDKNRTIYVFSFNPVLFPALRIGFAVVPSPLVDRFSAAIKGLKQHANGPNQMVLADFMNDGHFEDHLRRLAEAYPERRSTLIKNLELELSRVVTPVKRDIGTQVVATLNLHREKEFIDLCARRKIVLRGMSDFRVAQSKTEEVLFSFAGFAPATIVAAVHSIRSVVP